VRYEFRLIQSYRQFVKVHRLENSGKSTHACLKIDNFDEGFHIPTVYNATAPH
jgi:hypothetical protein